MSLLGKGYFIWKIPYCDRGDPAAIAARAKAANLTHVLIKIADGPTWPYNFDFDRNLDLIPPVKEALEGEGVEVWGWHYVRGDDPVSEARIAVERTQSLGMSGYVIDAEGEYRNKSKWIAATRFMQELRAELPNLPMGLSTYRYPRMHPNFPFEQFLEYCDLSMPQVYFEQMHDPEAQLDKTVEQYMALQPARPIVPTAPTYARGSWSPSAAEIKRFFAKARELGLSGANAWSWDFAARPEYMHLWNAVADFEWPVVAPVADIPERLLGRMNEHDPVFVSKLYAQNAAHVTGERTIIGQEAVRQWYQALLMEQMPGAKYKVVGKSGEGRSRHFLWQAEGPQGRVLDGNDTLGLVDGRIQYHYTYFTIS